MKLTDVIKVRKTQFAEPARYVARVGTRGPEGCGATREAALSDLVNELETREEFLFTEAIRWTKDGSVWILGYDSSWTYRRFAPGSQQSSGTTVLASAKTYTQALEAMVAHIQQYDANSAAA